MVELGEFGNVAGDIFGSLTSITLAIVVGVIVFGAIGSLVYYFLIYKRKFNIDVKIISKRARDNFVHLDRAAILWDRKEKENYLKLWSLKKEISIPPFKVLLNSNKGDYLELYRTSEDGFSFLTPSRIDEEMIIRADGKAYPLKKTIQRQIESDTAWLIQRKARDRRTFDPDTLLGKLIQYAPILVPAAFMFIISLVFLNYLPEVLNSLANVADRIASIQGVASKVG